MFTGVVLRRMPTKITYRRTFKTTHVKIDFHRRDLEMSACTKLGLIKSTSGRAPPAKSSFPSLTHLTLYPPPLPFTPLPSTIRLEEGRATVAAEAAQPSPPSLPPRSDRRREGLWRRPQQVAAEAALPFPLSTLPDLVGGGERRWRPRQRRLLLPSSLLHLTGGGEGCGSGGGSSSLPSPPPCSQIW
jgi:hypothetical protein